MKFDMKIGFACLSTEDQTIALPLDALRARCLSACVLALSLLAVASPALAQEFKSGSITIEGPWAPATPKGAEVGSGYFTIQNHGESPERLTGLAADFGALELHETKTEDGVLSMPELKNGLNIPAHGAVRLAPGRLSRDVRPFETPARERRKGQGGAYLRARPATDRRV